MELINSSRLSADSEFPGFACFHFHLHSSRRHVHRLPWLAFYVGAASSCMAGIFTNLTVSPVSVAFLIYDFRYFWIVSFLTQWESKSLRSSFPQKQNSTCDTHFSVLYAIKTSVVFKVIDGCFFRCFSNELNIEVLGENRGKYVCKLRCIKIFFKHNHKGQKKH